MVKVAISVLFAAALASSVLAQEVPSFSDDLVSRDVPVGGSVDLFGRAAVKVINDLFSREELSDLLGRDIEELDQRDLDELFQREVEFDESFIAREDTEAAPDAHPAPPQPTATGAPPKPTASGAPSKPTTTGAATPAHTSGAATPSGAPAPPETEGSIAKIINFFSTLFTSKPPAPAQPGTGASSSSSSVPTATSKPKSSAAPAPPAPTHTGADAAGAAAGGSPPPATDTEATPAAREFYEEPIERSLDYANELEELIARYLSEEPEMYEARGFEDEAFEDVVERDFEPDFEERDFEEEWDEELMRRALDILEELEQLD